MANKRKPTERKPRAPTPPAPDSMLGFPARLRKLIDEQGLNYTTAAELTGFSVPTVLQWANGEQFEGIKASNVIRLAEKLGVRFAWLLTGEEPKSLRSVPFVGDPEVVRRLEALERRLPESPSPEVRANKGHRPGNLQR